MIDSRRDAPPRSLPGSAPSVANQNDRCSVNLDEDVKAQSRYNTVAKVRESLSPDEMLIAQRLPRDPEIKSAAKTRSPSDADDYTVRVPVKI
jgi:hypothetical protein